MSEHVEPAKTKGVTIGEYVSAVKVELEQLRRERNRLAATLRAIADETEDNADRSLALTALAHEEEREAAAALAEVEQLRRELGRSDRLHKYAVQANRAEQARAAKYETERDEAVAVHDRDIELITRLTDALHDMEASRDEAVAALEKAQRFIAEWVVDADDSVLEEVFGPPIKEEPKLVPIMDYRAWQRANEAPTVYSDPIETIREAGYCNDDECSRELCGGCTCWHHAFEAALDSLTTELAALRPVAEYAAGMPDDDSMPEWARELRHHAREALALLSPKEER